MNYSVNYWGSHPDAENDDCHTGYDFDSASEAIAFFKAPIQALVYVHCTEYIEIDGLDDSELAAAGIECLRKNPDFKRTKDTEFEANWWREQAWEAGMGLGVEAYNDAMGY